MIELDHLALIVCDFPAMRLFRNFIATLEVDGPARVIFLDHEEDGSCCRREDPEHTVRRILDALEGEGGKHVDIVQHIETGK